MSSTWRALFLLSGMYWAGITTVLLVLTMIAVSRGKDEKDGEWIVGGAFTLGSAMMSLFSFWVSFFG